MSQIILSFENIVLPLEVTASDIREFKSHLVAFLLSIFGSVNLYSSFTILVSLINGTSLIPANFSVAESTTSGTIECDVATANFIANTFADRICRAIEYNVYTLNIKDTRKPSTVDEDFISKLSNLNLSSSSSDSGNESFTVTIRKDASLGQIFDSIINNAKDYLPIKSIKDALLSSVDKFTSPKGTSMGSLNTSRISRSQSDTGMKSDKSADDLNKRLLSNLSASDFLNAMSRGCSNTCNVSCPKCEYVIVRNVSESNVSSLCTSYVNNTFIYTPRKPLIEYMGKFIVNYDSIIHDVDINLMETKDKNITLAFLDVLFTLHARKSPTTVTEVSTYIKRHYKRDIPLLSNASSARSFTVIDDSGITTPKSITPISMTQVIERSFVDSVDKKVITPDITSNVISPPPKDLGIINVRDEVVKKIYDTNGTLIMDFSNITLEIIREGHTYKFVTSTGSYDSASSFLSYIVDLYGVHQTLELFLNKFIGMPDTQFQDFLNMLIFKTKLLKRMMLNDIYREAITPIFLESFFTINKEKLKPLLRRMVEQFDKFDDKGYFVNNFIPLKVYYQHSASKDSIKSMVCK